MKNNNKIDFFKYLLATAVFLILLLADQISKYLIVSRLDEGQEINIISNVFVLKYIKNFGAAFGILQNKRLFFCILTFLFMVLVIRFFCIIPSEKKYRPLRITVILLSSGAVGNFIDRLFLVYVRDFLYFKLINFPIFNFADIYVVVAAFLLMILVLFYYKDEDFYFIKEFFGKNRFTSKG